jgi:type IV pilus assembly protein PilQ
MNRILVSHRAFLVCIITTALTASGLTSAFPPLPPELLHEKPNQVAQDTPISLEFNNADLPAVLQAFADFSGLNIIASEQIQGKVSLRLDQVPWRRAFDTLLEVQGLAMRQHGNIIWVATIAEMAAQARLRLEAQTRATTLEPLVNRAFALHYQRADEVYKLLTGAGAQKILSQRGTAIADVRTNQLFVTDLASHIAQVQAMLSAIDQPLKQVLIEARIVEAEKGYSRTLGAQLSALQAGERAAGSKEAITLADGIKIALPASPLSGFNAASAGLTLFGAAASRVLALELSALEADGRVRILSSPRVVTADRIKALIEQGTELPYQAKVGNGVSGVQFRRASLKLEVMPNILSDDQVLLNVDISKDSVGTQTLSGPAINTKHIRTQVQIENGGTVVIGGIFTQDAHTDMTRVPWLGTLPLLGALFRHQMHRETSSELLIFITPSVIPPVQKNQMHTAPAPASAPSRRSKIRAGS